MGLNTSGSAEYAAGKTGSVDLYGHADYNRDKKAGMSDYEIKKLIDADPSKMGNGGTSGDLYQQISSGAKPPQQQQQQPAPQQQAPQPPKKREGTIGREGFRKAYGPEFQENLNEATTAYQPEEKPPAMENPEYEGLGTDFRKQVDKETAIKDNDPFEDSWNSTDFYGKHMTMGREAQKGRGDATSIANKYIFNAAETNPVDYEALDKQIRTAPLYSESKAELKKAETFGDTYANSQNPPTWNQPQAPAAYEAPDFQSMYDKTKKDLEGISL